MKIAPAVLALAVAVSLTACSSSDADQSATDPAAPSSAEPSATAPAKPTEVPAAPGEVRSRDLVMVLESEENGRPELCVGPTIDIYPPQCGGPPVLGWDWAEQKGVFEKEGTTRWGSFAVSGTWDGTALTVSGAVPAALYDPAAAEPPTLPEPAQDYREAELTAIAEDVGTLPGATGAFSDTQGHVLVDVLYDDGSLQDYADSEYGAGVVVVTSQLVDQG